MKLYLACLLSLLFAAFVSAVDRPTASLPAVSGGIVCAMSLCPTATLSKRDLACPAHCKDNCRIIDDQCCPGTQKAICNSNSSSIVDSSSLTTSSSVAIPTSSSLIATSSISPSSLSSSPSSSSVQPSQSAINNTPSSAESTRIVWSSVLLMVFVTFIMNAF